MNRYANARGGRMYSALSSPTDWVLRYIKTYLYLFSRSRICAPVSVLLEVKLSCRASQ